jgi:ferredoxin
MLHKLLNARNFTQAASLWLNLKFSQNEAVILEKNGQKLAICVELDSELGGVAAYLGDYDDKLDVSAIFEGKSFASVKIIKAENE